MKVLFDYLVVNDDTVLAENGPMPPDMFLCGTPEEVRTMAQAQFDEWDETAEEGVDEHPYYGHLEIFDDGTFRLNDLHFERQPKTCPTCGDTLDKDCQGNRRCPTCDGPCPCCSDGPGPGETDTEHERNEVEALAERLTAAGDVASFEETFGTKDTNLDLSTLDDDAIHEIYQEYCQED